MIFGTKQTEKILSQYWLLVISCLGVLIYAVTGFASLLLGGKYLEFNVFFNDLHLAQFIGIMAIEIGVQLAVFGSLTLIFLKLAEQD
jgi:multicomponent Na+:H+ antiporter subunit B